MVLGPLLHLHKVEMQWCDDQNSTESSKSSPWVRVQCTTRRSWQTTAMWSWTVAASSAVEASPRWLWRAEVSFVTSRDKTLRLLYTAKQEDDNEICVVSGSRLAGPYGKHSLPQ